MLKNILKLASLNAVAASQQVKQIHIDLAIEPYDPEDAIEGASTKDRYNSLGVDVLPDDESPAVMDNIDFVYTDSLKFLGIDEQTEMADEPFKYEVKLINYFNAQYVGHLYMGGKKGSSEGL